MSSMFQYQLPVEETEWAIEGETSVSFQWEYEDGNENLLKLYDMGKKLQWDAAERIDWSQDLDPENPMLMPDSMIRIYGSPVWEKLNEKERANLRRHAQAWQISQFLHGEQGALICSARIVEQVPDMTAKFYAATQVMDEARHVEAYSRLLHDKFEMSYPITPPLKALLNDIVTDKRWDFTYLGMQVLVEGLALAAFQSIRDMSQNPLSAAVNAYVMQDEARHVAFGRWSLRDVYPQMMESERREREDFVIEASRHMRDRFTSSELWGAVGLDEDECVKYVETSDTTRAFRGQLFSRITPIIKDIGLWTPRVKEAYEKMGLLFLTNPDEDVDVMLANDAGVAEDFDARQRIMETIKVGEGERSPAI